MRELADDNDTSDEDGDSVFSAKARRVKGRQSGPESEVAKTKRLAAFAAATKARPKLQVRRHALIARAHALRQEADALEELAEKSAYGRVSKYKPEYAIRATDMCLLGLTNEEIAARFGVNINTFNAWVASNDEFRHALWEGREGADQQVSRALWRAAKGYEHEEVDIRSVPLGNNQGSEIRVTNFTRHYPPNERAAAIWLGSRQRARFAALQPEPPRSETPQELAAAVRAAIRAAMSTAEPPEDAVVLNEVKEEGSKE